MFPLVYNVILGVSILRGWGCHFFGEAIISGLAMVCDCWAGPKGPPLLCPAYDHPGAYSFFGTEGLG